MQLCVPIIAALHWQYPHAAVAVVPATLGFSAYVLWAYLPQVRQVGRSWAWVLPGLRLAAFAGLAVSLLRPAVTRPRTAAERGPVVFLIDNSRSMAVADTGRPPGQRVAVAAAMGRLPPGSRDTAAVSVEAATEQLAPLTDAVARARAEVGYARLAGRETEAATARLDAAIETLRQSAKTVSDAVSASGSVQSPRLERLLALLATTPAAVDRETWLDRAGDRARNAAVEAATARTAADGRLYDDDPAVHDAADAIAAQSRERLAWSAAFDPQAGLLARLNPDTPVETFTIGDHVGTVSNVSDAPEPDGVASDLAGGVRSVLERLTANTAAEPPRAIVLLSDGRQVNGPSAETVASVAAGVPVHTIAVASRSPSPNVGVADLAVPRYTFSGEPVTCRATLRPTAVAGVTTDVTFTAGEDRQTRRVAFAGDRPMPIAFTWTPRTPGPTRLSIQVEPVPDEATDADNADEAWTAVIGAPVRVAFVSPTVGWPSASTGMSLASSHAVRLVPGGLAELGDADVVVLFDVTGRSLSLAQWEAVSRSVTDRGGGVILVPGDGGFGPGVSPSSPLGRLLPFVGPPPTWVARPLGAFKASSDSLWLADTRAESARRWASLPALEGYLPAAAFRLDTRALLLAGDVPVVTERVVGAGRVLSLASDQMWKWRLAPDGSRDVDRFWELLVREAAGDPYAVESGGVSLDTDSFAVLPGQTVHVRLKTVDSVAARLRILRKGAPMRTVPFRSRGGGRYDLTLASLPSGDYTLEADAGAVGNPRVPLQVKPSTDAELADLSGDEGFLHRLSEATGGKSFGLDQLDAVAAELSAPAPDGSHPIELSLWDGPYLYAGVLGLLTAEWALRRKAGLA